MTDVPTEITDECSGDNDDFDRACEVASGQTIDGTARDGKIDDDLFRISPREARGGLLVALEHGSPGTESGFSERIFVGTQMPLLLDELAAPPGRITERRVGVRPGYPYFVALTTDADSSYRLTLTYEDALYELEPNDSPALADDLGDAEGIRGGALAGSARDIDFFRVHPPEGTRALAIVLTHVDRSKTSKFELVANPESDPTLDLDGGFVEAGDPLEREIGVVPDQAYLLQVRNWSGGSHEYEIALTWSERLRELEPNDTAEQAQALAPDETVRGSARMQADDDVDRFTVVAPESASAGVVTLVQLADGEPRSRFAVTVLDPNGTDALATGMAENGDTFTLPFTAEPGLVYGVEVDTVAGGLFEYDLTVSFE